MAGEIRPGQEAIDEALAQLAMGEAPQIGVLGDTGCGKTTLTLQLVAAYLKRSPGSVLIVDDKELTTKYQGQLRRDRDDIRRNPIDWQQGRVTVLRGEPRKGERVELEEVAEMAWARAQNSRKTLVVYDELIAGREETLCKNSQWRKGVTWLPRSFTMGRSPGIANIWGAQSPSDVPNEPFNQSSVIFTFRLAGTGLARLNERDYLEGGADDVVPRLPGPPCPLGERGYFVALFRGRPWNGKIYRVQGG